MKRQNEEIKNKGKKIIYIIKKILKISEFTIGIIGLIIGFISLSVAKDIGKEANKIAKKQEIIARKSEAVKYDIIASSKEIYYSFENGEKILSYTPALKVKKGVIDELEIIKYNGRKIKILDKPNEKLMKAFCLSDMVLELKIEQNITKNHNDYIFYDYFFIFIKAGDGSEHLDLIYSKIDLNNKKKGIQANNKKENRYIR